MPIDLDPGMGIMLLSHGGRSDCLADFGLVDGMFNPVEKPQMRVQKKLVGPGQIRLDETLQLLMEQDADLVVFSGDMSAYRLDLSQISNLIFEIRTSLPPWHHR